MPFICATASFPASLLTLRRITAFISLQDRLSRFFHIPNVPGYYARESLANSILSLFNEPRVASSRSVFSGEEARRT